MKKALITGSEGFVGKYLRTELKQNGYNVIGLDLVPGPHTVCIDLLNPEQVNAFIQAEKPENMEIPEKLEMPDNQKDTESDEFDLSDITHTPKELSREEIIAAAEAAAYDS